MLLVCKYELKNDRTLHNNYLILEILTNSSAELNTKNQLTFGDKSTVNFVVHLLRFCR